MELWQKLKTNTGQIATNLRQAQERYREEHSASSKHSSTHSSKEDVNKNSSASKKPSKVLLVIDSAENDWAKIFKGKTMHNGSYDIRVEQAEFSDLNLASYSDSGTMVDIQVCREGTVVVRSFRPDFVLVRESVRGIGPKEDYRNIILGLQFGNVPSINSLESIYNFAEKPWVFAHLIQIMKRLGKDQFPLIEQAYYPNYKEMLITPRFPVVVKVGHGNSGYGKVCVQNHRSFQDIASVVALSGNYATTEPFVAGKCDIRIQKIGDHCRAFKRTSISDNWKTNTGSAVLEEIELTERYKQWADECSELFGGLDILCVEVIQGKDKKDYIVEVTDTCMRLFNDTREEDQQRMAALVIKKMEAHYPPIDLPSSPTHSVTSGTSSPSPGSKTKPIIEESDGAFSGVLD
ncbi:synapsin-2-like [Actinia tenebrosa]|uniref:Synapsin-2-like n=1 Tax=Actinia tenebrosa TaxID=6105 RepID=A0A6P8HZ56_ACTTE|nr:synapsin-2-like [Actinia tenebrosa]XP_031561665.1 synapsin-2-like [Actinia tenebrosa]